MKIAGGVRRIAIGLSAAVALLGIAAVVRFRPDIALRVATGFTAHTLCSWAFLDARDPGTTFREDVATQPGMGLVAPLIRFEVDRAEKEARVSVMGFFGARARFTDGRGCRLVHASETPLAALPPPKSSAPPLEIDLARPAIEAALDRAFASPSQGPLRHTRAIVVLRDGRIAAERYANGFGPRTVFWGHSLSKSVTHALLGVLAMAGRFDPDAAADVPEWRDAGDARAAITAGELMRMTAGFPPDETWPGWDRSSRMWFVEDDERLLPRASSRPASRVPHGPITMAASCCSRA
jgi:Beta-lactamase